MPSTEPDTSNTKNKNADGYHPLVRTHDLSLPAWGPYTKHYMGISHIPDVARGYRFDLSLVPGFHRKKAFLPHVLHKPAYHPWEAAPDLSYYSHRHEMDGRAVTCDIAFMRDGESMLGCAEFCNESAREYLCALHVLAALYPPARTAGCTEAMVPSRVSLPPGAEWLDGAAFASCNLPSTGIRRSLSYDGRRSGEALGDGFTGLFGVELAPADAASYRWETERSFDDAALLIRYRCDSNTQLEVDFAGRGRRTVALPAAIGFALASLPVSGVAAGESPLHITHTGAGRLEIDGFVLVEKVAAAEVVFEPAPPRRHPLLHSSVDDLFLLLEYEDVDTCYGVRWDWTPSKFRQFECADLEEFHNQGDNNPKKHFYKGRGEGVFTTADLLSIPLAVGETRRLWFRFATGDLNAVRRQIDAPLDDGYCGTVRAKARAAARPEYDPEGEPFAFAHRRMAATTLTNIVYPVRTRGSWIRHHTPGRVWDSLYTWDSGLIGIGLLELDETRAIENLNAYVTEPDQDDAAFIHHGTPVPTQFFLFHELWNRTGSDELLRFFYPRLVNYHRFLAGRHGSSNTRNLRSGLLRTWDYFYNSGGWDDYPPQHFVSVENRETLTKRVTPVINTACAIRTAKILTAAAHALGEDTTEFERDTEEFTRALQSYAWDEDSGYFGYVEHDGEGHPQGILRHAGGWNFNCGADGLSPLLAGACNERQESLALERLFSPDRMWTPWGLSVVDQSAPYFRHDGYWNGTVWMPYQWMFWKAMLDLGRVDEAWRIARAVLEAWKKEIDHWWDCPEHLSIRSGASGGWNHFSGLSSPLLALFGAYFTPRRLSTGWDARVVRQIWQAKDALRAELVFSGQPRHRPAVLLTWPTGSEVHARWNGEHVHGVRRSSTVSIQLPGGRAKGVLEARSTPFSNES
ncbi:MAG: trehalase family glycosidase [Opitutales bacterium]